MNPLWTGLVDDAAVFPPGSAPLPEAVREHVAHRSAWYAACVGPLLVPASAAGELGVLVADLVEPVRLSVIGRPGTPAAEVAGAVELLRHTDNVEVVGAELGWTPDWREASFGALPLTLEVPRGTAQGEAFADLAAALAEGSSVQAKLRTGATPTWPWPDESELAAFLRSAADQRLPFKLTGGLHHVVRATHPAPGSGAEEQHGLLNVFTAVDAALRGAPAAELGDLLAQRDSRSLVSRVAGLSDAEATRVRTLFTAYGCCGVTDPIGELSTLHLIEEN